MPAQAAPSDFVGTWRLLDYSFIHDDGSIEHPWGTNVRGYLLYSAEGYMSGNLSPAHDWQSRRARIKAALKAHDGTAALRNYRAAGVVGCGRRAGRRQMQQLNGRFDDRIGRHFDDIAVSREGEIERFQRVRPSVMVGEQRARPGRIFAQ